MRIIFVLLLSTIFINNIVLSAEMVLQNGLNGYLGCVDTWIVKPIGNNTKNIYSMDTNCGDSMSLKCELIPDGMS